AADVSRAGEMSGAAARAAERWGLQPVRRAGVSQRWAPAARRVQAPGSLERPAPRARKPLGSRLTRRGRVLLTALVAASTLAVAVLLWLSAAAGAQAASSGASPGSVYRNLTRVVVQPGQSLWTIALRAAPGADPRVVVQRIIDLNGLGGQSIQPGERLWVPSA
ncbi:MAG: LysM peptidoglycan-binding domain-containing protein, partial [Nocardiopsaceae bacterium]|nr:LysM peptidoglycan-binding domain-containing protein [Nocardiopsaceae bacterium]